MPSPSSPHAEQRRGGERRSAPAIRRRGGSAAARGRGKRERELRGADSRPHLGRGWRVEVGRREQAAAALAACGGGAGDLGEEWASVVGDGGTREHAGAFL